MKLIQILSALVVTFGVGDALAQAYPGKPVRVIVPFTAGSTTDMIARTVSQKLSEAWGQPAVVENRTGAGGTIAAGVVAKSPPDGYTLLVNSNAHAVNPALYASLPYDPLTAFVDIAPLAGHPNVLVVGTSAGARSVAELIAAAKAKPGQIHFGSSGVGSGTHLIAEKFRLAAGIDVVHVPYKGGPEATADTIAGRVAYWFPPVSLALPHTREGRLLALGVTSARRSSLLPEVPTIAEAGVPGFDVSQWYGMWAPAGTPERMVDKLAQDISRALAAPDLRDRFNKIGIEPMAMTPSEFTRFVRSETEDSARIIKAAGIEPQ
jgi:tripartite-type tricarboxylate transporter receptor subunit TctC